MTTTMAGGVAQTDDFVALTIFSKTFMPGGCCYFGIDSLGHIKMPIYRQQLSWDENITLITVGYSYLFKLTHENIQPKLPLTNEVVVVASAPTICLGMEPVDMYAALDRLATEFPVCLFGGHMRERKYVVPNTNCPSVGVLKVNGGDVKYWVNPKEYVKNRVKIHIDGQHYDFPYTGDNMSDPTDADALVVLCLGAPCTHDEQIPKRCYILVVHVEQQEQKN